MAAESSATTAWEGALTEGRGETTTRSGTLDRVEVTWPARVERTDDTTSPEELLAAAHASCFCMALSHELGEAGTPPQRLEATATVSFVGGEGIKSSRIAVRGVVPGCDRESFERAVASAGEGCPVSQALAGNVEVAVEGGLDG